MTLQVPTRSCGRSPDAAHELVLSTPDAELRALTVNLIAAELFRGSGPRRTKVAPTGTVRGRRVTENLEGRQRLELTRCWRGDGSGPRPA